MPRWWPKLSGRAVALAIALVACVPASAGATAGTITEYPIPIETTPRGVAAGPDGKIWFLDSGNHVGGTFVGRMTTSGAIATSDLVQLPTSKLGFAIAAGPDGNMWLSQDEVDKVPLGATLTSEITPYTPEGGAHASGTIVTGPDGRLWFGANKQIGAITTSGVATTYETSLSGISAVTVGSDGKLWYADENTIARIDTSGHSGAGDVFPLPAGKKLINALALGPDGNVWFTLGLPAAVGRITPAGTITIFETPTPSSLPFGIAAGPDNLIWFTERFGDKIGSIPVTASSGSNIVEYPVAHVNTGLLHIAAGPDGRMWFAEFNTNSLGAITTDVTPPVVPAPVVPPPVTTSGETKTTSETPLTPSPVSTPSPSTPFQPFAQLPSPVGCVANKLVLTDVFPQSGRTQVLGVAPTAAVGKRVSIISTWNGKPVARATVLADHSFKASLPLPPRSLRFTNRATYEAKLGPARSAALKFIRRMYTTAVTASGRSIIFSGTVSPPFAKRVEPVKIRASAVCATINSGTIVANVKLQPSGSYTATFPLPSSLQNAPAVYLQAETRVRVNTKSNRTYPTFTLIRGVKLSP